MPEFSLVNLLLNVISVIPVLSLTIYLSIHIALKYTYFRELDSKFNKIRKKVLKTWEKNHRTFEGLLDGVPLEQLRVLGRHNEKDESRFKLIRNVFFILSGVLILSGIICKAIAIEYLSSSDFFIYSLIVLFLVYLISLSQLILMTNYEYGFYKTLDELNNSVEQND